MLWRWSSALLLSSSVGASPERPGAVTGGNIHQPMNGSLMAADDPTPDPTPSTPQPAPADSPEDWMPPTKDEHERMQRAQSRRCPCR